MLAAGPARRAAGAGRAAGTSRSTGGTDGPGRPRSAAAVPTVARRRPSACGSRASRPPTPSATPWPQLGLGAASGCSGAACRSRTCSSTAEALYGQPRPADPSAVSDARSSTGATAPLRRAPRSGRPGRDAEPGAATGATGAGPPPPGPGQGAARPRGGHRLRAGRGVRRRGRPPPRRARSATPRHPDLRRVLRLHHLGASSCSSPSSAPEVLCPDRRTGMLGLYLASPLTRDTYLLAKAAAVAGAARLVTLGPPLLLLVAFILQGLGPDGPGDVGDAAASASCWPGSLLAGRLHRRVAGRLQPHRPPGGRRRPVVHPAPARDRRGHRRPGRGRRRARVAARLQPGRRRPFELVQRIYGERGRARPDIATALLVAVQRRLDRARAAACWSALPALVVTR